MDQKLNGFVVRVDGDEKIFWTKLLAQTGWSTDFARSAYVEYLRFILLVANCESRVVPSKIIDKVWHLHLTFTQSYWIDLCRNVLGKEIHHRPSSSTQIGVDEDFYAYRQTLTLYKMNFSQTPPDQFWPMPKQQKKTWLRWAELTILTASVTACSASEDSSFITYVKWGAGIYVVYKILRWLASSGGGRGGGSGGAGCSSSCGSGCGGGD